MALVLAQPGDGLLQAPAPTAPSLRAWRLVNAAAAPGCFHVLRTDAWVATSQKANALQQLGKLAMEQSTVSSWQLPADACSPGRTSHHRQVYCV